MGPDIQIPRETRLTKLSEDFEYALDRFEGLKGGPAPGDIDTNRYRGKIPQSLLDFWGLHGLGTWLEGYFQFCDPDKYQPVIKEIFGNDSEFIADRCHLVGFSAFGNMLVWNEDFQVTDVDVIRHSVSALRYIKPDPSIDPDIAIGVSVSSVDDSAYDAVDEDGNDLFKPLLKALGPTGFGRIYAPKLYPAMGGSITFENFHLANALEALIINARSAPFILKDVTDFNQKIIREIG